MGMMKTTTETKHKFFMKIMTTQVLKPYLKEACPPFYPLQREWFREGRSLKRLTPNAQL